MFYQNIISKPIDKIMTDREILELTRNYVDYSNRKRKEILNKNSDVYKNNISYRESIADIHNNSILYLENHNIQLWKSYDNSNIYYRINSYGGRKKLKSHDELYSFLRVHLKIYDTLEEIQYVELDSSMLILVSDYFNKIKDEVFYPYRDEEWVNFNQHKYKNIFQHSIYLKNRLIIDNINRMRRILNSSKYRIYKRYDRYDRYQRFSFRDSIRNSFTDQYFETSGYRLKLLEEQLETQSSIICNFISYLSQNEYQFNYIMAWLANFYKTLNKSSMALVLIGDEETTDIFINNIIKPIFACKSEYFCTIDSMLKRKHEAMIKDKIFYHINTDKLSTASINDKHTSKLVKRIIKLNSNTFEQSLINNEIYVWGELIITSSKNSPYPFLKDNYSGCKVFKAKNIKYISKKLDIDYLSLEEEIKKDLDNFSKILLQYNFKKEYLNIDVTPEREALPSMKNGVLRTEKLNQQIDKFVTEIKNKNLSYFTNIEEKNSEMYKELIENFDEDMIAQPLLSEYFHLIVDDIIFPNNSSFLDVLKEEAEMFKKTPSDKSKRCQKKRYKIQ